MVAEKSAGAQSTVNALASKYLAHGRMTMPAAAPSLTISKSSQLPKSSFERVKNFFVTRTRTRRDARFGGLEMTKQKINKEIHGSNFCQKVKKMNIILSLIFA